jgi:hypothetical protein
MIHQEMMLALSGKPGDEVQMISAGSMPLGQAEQHCGELAS